MHQFIAPTCENMCGAVTDINEITESINYLEEVALDQGCDIYGGEIDCEQGPILLIKGANEEIKLSCRAICDIPQVVNVDYPSVAGEFNVKIRGVLSNLFELGDAT